MTDADHLINPALIGMALSRLRTSGMTKWAFIPAGDPSMGGGAPPGGDPSGGAGGPPPGGDPSGGAGGAPPPGGGGGGFDPTTLQPMIQQMVQQAMMQGGGGGGGAGAGSGAAGLKPKIDVNVEIMQLKNMIAKICDQLGVQIPAQDMVATPDKLNAMAQGQSPTSAGGASGGATGGAPGGAIQPMGGMDPMAGAGVPGAAPPGPEKAGAYRGNGRAFDSAGLAANSNRAQAIAAFWRKRPER